MGNVLEVPQLSKNRWCHCPHEGQILVGWWGSKAYFQRRSWQCSLGLESRCFKVRNRQNSLWAQISRSAGQTLASPQNAVRGFHLSWASWESLQVLKRACYFQFWNQVARASSCDTEPEGRAAEIVWPLWGTRWPVHLILLHNSLDCSSVPLCWTSASQRAQDLRVDLKF